MPLPIDIFFDRIRDGYWQDLVLSIRAMKTKEERNIAKKNAPCVTLSGRFANRKDNECVSSSGLIGIDIDDIEDPEDTKSFICTDRHVYAAFKSISGRGLCVVFHINPEKHREAFAGISQYLYENYNLVCDPTSVNPARARFISFDPHLYLNINADKFTQYPKHKAPKKVETVVFAHNDFEQIIQEISQRGIDICPNYHDWLRVGFALADKFQEGGRNYFHTISATSAKYNAKDCDKQYTNCLKAHGMRIATISTFYYYCKQAGINTISDRTRTIISAANQAKKGRRTITDTINNLEKFEQIPEQESKDIIEQVFNNNINTPSESLLDQIEQWLTHNYELRRNLITRQIENNGIVLQEPQRNGIWRAAKKIFEKVQYEDLQRLINSDFTPSYNPLHEFFISEWTGRKGNIDAVIKSIKTDNGAQMDRFIRKWIVSCVASAFGNPSRLQLILTGKQRSGKTEWFRRLLPKELQHYYGEVSPGMKETDFNIMMTQKLIIVDDEFEAKNKKDESANKSLLSKRIFTVREPYGRTNVDLPRLANMGATSNEDNLLSDPTGNTRYIAVHVLSIDHALYNSVNKRDLWLEAYNLYINGFDYELSFEDLEILSETSKRFENYSLEYELINKYMRQPTQQCLEELTATEIKNKLEVLSVQKLNLNKLGKELKRVGFEQVIKRRGLSFARIYQVMFTGSFTANNTPSVNTQDYVF